ncbi:MAG TPA: MBL fold metallo-hydrolase [Candidatus Nanopelagicaceae bacterium]|nr:MBL fold metallo-hydrolase [Candidatus Nanopelagicaceae bacterium]
MTNIDTQMEIIWLGHACFKIKMFSGRVIYLDPYNIKDGEEKADIIVSSHTHGDHFSKSDIKKIWQDDTVLLGPISIANSLKKFGGQGLEIGEEFAYKDLSIELFPAYTIEKITHPKSNNWTGTIIESAGKIVYHAGDTERIPEMKDLKTRNITVALLPCGGTYTMDFEEASNAAVDIQPEIVVPMHNWEKDLNIFKEIMAKKDSNIRVEILTEKSLKI